MSNEELQRQIIELQERLDAVENAHNLDMKELLFDGLFSNKGSYGSDIQRIVTIGPDGGSFTILEDPIATIIIDYKGTKYRLPLYSLS